MAFHAICSGATSFGVCGPHTCSAAHIRDLQMMMASPSSGSTAHLLASLKIYSSPRSTQFTCHVLLYSTRLMKAKTSDLVPRNNHPCSEVPSADLFQFQFFLCSLPKMLKVKTDALCFFMLAFISTLRLDVNKYCTFTYILFPLLLLPPAPPLLPCPARLGDLRHFSDTSGSAVTADKCDGSH